MEALPRTALLILTISLEPVNHLHVPTRPHVLPANWPRYKSNSNADEEQLSKEAHKMRESRILAMKYIAEHR